MHIQRQIQGKDDDGGYLSYQKEKKGKKFIMLIAQLKKQYSIHVLVRLGRGFISLHPNLVRCVSREAV